MSKAKEAIFNELMSQLAESQNDEGSNTEDSPGIENFLWQRYLEHMARTQAIGKAKAQGWLGTVVHFLGKK